MASSNERSHTPTAKTTRLRGKSLKNTTSQSFCIQKAPPLSIQQYLRCASGVLPGAKEWQPNGKYRPPPLRAFLSPATRDQVKKPEPVWHPPGRYQEKRPTSLSPEKRKENPQKPLVIWNPPGKPEKKPLPYFDAPSLRWSLTDLLRSTPMHRSQSFHASSSMSTSRKSEKMQEA